MSAAEQPAESEPGSSGTDILDEETVLAETKAPSATPQPTFTPRPSASPMPGFDVPFVFVSAEEICDPELPEGLLQVYVLDQSGEGMAGVRLHITWEGGEEYFYTVCIHSSVWVMRIIRPLPARFIHSVPVRVERLSETLLVPTCSGE